MRFFSFFMAIVIILSTAAIEPNHHHADSHDHSSDCQICLTAHTPAVLSAYVELVFVSLYIPIAFYLVHDSYAQIPLNQFPARDPPLS